MKTFIDEHRAVYGVEPICKLLPIAPSTYYAHAARQADPRRRPARAVRDTALMPEIERVWNENFQVYGVRKVWRQLRREQIDVARCTVARLMKHCGLRGVVRGKTVRTTFSDKNAPCPLDHVRRNFKADRPNKLWVVAADRKLTIWSTFGRQQHSGSPTSPTCRPGRASSMSPSSSTSSHVGSSAGGRRHRRGPTSCSMRWSRPYTSASRSARIASFITATAASSPGSMRRRNA